jgi:acyl-CoA thioester hydrolase
MSVPAIVRSVTQYAFSTGIDVHLRDIDRGHHVNNSVLVSYLEQARDEYLDGLVGYLDDDVYIVVATLEMQFQRPIAWGETATIDLRVPEVGTSSFRIEYRVRVDGTTAATAETLMVTYDRDAEESIPVPEEWRDRLVADNDRFLDRGSDA